MTLDSDMPTCQQCGSDLPEGRKRFCSNECGIQFHNQSRKPTDANVEDAVTREIDQAAHRLVIQGFLPEPYQIDPHDSRPLWDFAGLAQLFDKPPHELVELLVRNGPVHLAQDRGIPSSWAMLQNMRL